MKISTKLPQACQYLFVLNLIKYRQREKNCAARNFDLKIKFDLMINFLTFFYLKTLESLMVSA